MGVRTRFSSHSLAELFRDLYLGERTGILVLRREEGERRIHFGRGLIQFADSSFPDERPGRTLVAENLISTGALSEAERDAKTVGELLTALVNRGLIAKTALRRSLRSLVDRIVAACFQWEAGEAIFERRDSMPELLDVDILSTFEQILAGVENMTGFAPVAEAMSGLDNRLRLSEPSPVPLDRLPLSRTQGYVIARVDGQSCFSDLISTLPPGEEETASRFLFGLLVLGAVEYQPALSDGPFRVNNILRDHADRRALENMQEKTIQQAYRRMRKQNPHEVLGVTPNASRRAIEQAYGEAKNLFRRDRIVPRVRELYRAELGVIENRLIEAYLQLTQPERRISSASAEAASAGANGLDAKDLLKRPEHDKTRTRAKEDEAARSAELYFGKARQAMRSGDYYNAIQYAKLAISYRGDDARFFFTLADCQARNPEAKWQRMAEDNFRRATELDPWNPDYWISLGRFYKKRGLSLRARRQFEEALKLVPEHEVATQELRSLG